MVRWKGGYFAFQTLSLVLLLVIVPVAASAASPDLVWNRTFGGPLKDDGSSVMVASDGYVIAGSTQFSDDDIRAQLIRTDQNGNILWNKTYGDAGYHPVRAAIDSDDGYMLVGTTQPYENGGRDVYLIKTDLEGNTLWNKTYGGKGEEVGSSIAKVSDGYAIAGNSDSYGNNSSDVYVVRTDLNGNILWNKTYGVTGSDFTAAIAAIDGGFVIAGRTIPSDNSDPDIWLIRTDSAGNVLWSKTYDGVGYAVVKAMVAVDDGYLIAGRNIDLLKTDKDGNQLWRKRYSGTGCSESVASVIAVSDGCVLVGDRVPESNDIRFIPLDYNASLIKTDVNGNVLWSGAYDGGGMDQGLSVAAVDDGYIIAGATFKFGETYKSDVYLAKVGLANSSSLAASDTEKVTGTDVSTPLPQNNSSQKQTLPMSVSTSQPPVPSQTATPGCSFILASCAVVLATLVILYIGSFLGNGRGG